MLSNKIWPSSKYAIINYYWLNDDLKGSSKTNQITIQNIVHWVVNYVMRQLNQHQGVNNNIQTCQRLKYKHHLVCVEHWAACNVLLSILIIKLGKYYSVPTVSHFGTIQASVCWQHPEPMAWVNSSSTMRPWDQIRTMAMVRVVMSCYLGFPNYQCICLRSSLL